MERVERSDARSAGEEAMDSSRWYRMSIRFDTPGRALRSYEIPSMESVRADLIFLVISARVSVMRMREFGFGSDFDIFFVGSAKLMTRFAGARIVSGSVKMGSLEGYA